MSILWPPPPHVMPEVSALREDKSQARPLQVHSAESYSNKGNRKLNYEIYNITFTLESELG